MHSQNACWDVYGVGEGTQLVVSMHECMLISILRHFCGPKSFWGASSTGRTCVVQEKKAFSMFLFYFQGLILCDFFFVFIYIYVYIYINVYFK